MYQSPRKTLNNHITSKDLRTLSSDKSRVISVHNMLNNCDKENYGESMEKNVAASQQQLLRPALRSKNGSSGLSTVLAASPKTMKKHIRFNLASSPAVSQNNSENYQTPTPPPKEFKRMGTQRKTLRNERSVSTFVTPKERSILEENLQLLSATPKAPQGFVRSMCKFYSDNFTGLNRSNSFSETDSGACKYERKGSFRLFRSNSWSSRRKKTSTADDDDGGSSGSPQQHNEPILAENQRCSPSSSSTKSQDSGYSENSEKPTVQHLHSQRLQFLRSNMEVREDELDPNLTQLPAAPESLVTVNQFKAESSSMAKQVNNALGNIASLQAGLNLKRSMAEDDLTHPLPAPTNGALNFLRPQKSAHEKIRPKSFQESVNDLSQLSQLDFFGEQLAFSTPVRASFREKAKLRPRPHTAIHLEDARTPSKREAKTRLREMKTKGRRWSAVVDQSAGAAVAATADTIDPSLVAAWSQFVHYEPSIPALSSVVTPSINSSNHVGQARAGQLTSEVVSVDDHLSLGQLSATQLSENLSHFEIQGNSGNHEEGIIELEQSPTVRTPTSRAANGTTTINTSPVCEWWKDLHAWCEPECMTYLQSKPILQQQQIPMSVSSGSPNSSSTSSAFSEDLLSKEVHCGIVDTMKLLQRGAKSINVTFNSIDKHLTSKNFVHLGKSVQLLLNQVQQYVYDYNMGRMNSSSSSCEQDSLLDDSFKNYEWNFPGLRKNVAGSTQHQIEADIKSSDQDGIKELVLLQQRTVLQTVDRLKLCAHRSQYTPNQPMTEMTQILAQLRKAFDSMLDKMFIKELRPLVREIDLPTNAIAVRSALHSVIALGNEAGMGSSASNIGNLICVLLAKEGCVKALLKQCNPNHQKCQDVRILALRGLSAICCVADCIRELEQADGLQVIDQLLCSRGSLIEDRIESAGVLAQITSPWISDNHKIQNLDSYVYNMVNALTGLSRMNDGEETFLLVAAALANLTFMSPLASAAMKRCGTPEALVKAVKRSPFTTIFAKDQVVTVLANMAANANCRHDIEAIDGVGFLLAMLETKVTRLGQAEMSAAERVQKKAAIALSRLCNSAKVCRDLLRLNGVDRLVELCRNPSERNNSDAVLVSCLAVLRRLNANLDPGQGDDLAKVLRQLKAADLVKTNLVDSFMEYSKKQESYV